MSLDEAARVFVLPADEGEDGFITNSFVDLRAPSIDDNALISPLPPVIIMTSSFVEEAEKNPEELVF